MTSTQNESVSVEPLWVLGIVLEVPGPKRIGHWSRTHRKARVTTVSLLHTIDGEPANRIDTEKVKGC